MLTKRTLRAHESHIQSSSSDRRRNNKHLQKKPRMQIKGLPRNQRRQSQLMAGAKSRREIGNASVCNSATSRAPSTAATGSAFEEVRKANSRQGAATTEEAKMGRGRALVRARSSAQKPNLRQGKTAIILVRDNGTHLRQHCVKNPQATAR